MSQYDNGMEKTKKILTPRVILQVFVIVVLMPLLPVLISRRWDWWEAWLYALIAVAGFIISRVLAGRRHPDLLRERGRMLAHADAQPWDKLLAPLVGLDGALIPLFVGLETLFHNLMPFSAPVKIGGLVLIVAGYVVGTWALMTNRFFSGMVRLQTDRGHTVVSDGPYRWVRHPGYVGALLTYLGTPFFLDSRWALLAVLFLAVALVVRTRLEDRFLQQQLEGYAEYAKKVKFRLLSGIW